MVLIKAQLFERAYRIAQKKAKETETKHTNSYGELVNCKFVEAISCFSICDEALCTGVELQSRFSRVPKHVINSSSGGQKFETSVNTINSRHSPKYFGLKKGSVSYALVANHIPVNAKIIGANEHGSGIIFSV